MRIRLLAAALCLAAVSGCDLVTDPDPLEEFGYQQTEPGAEIETGIDVAAFQGEILLVGQLEAPSSCYDLTPSFSQSGNTLNLTISLRTRGTACPAVVTGYIWQAAIRRLKSGTYDLRVTHSYRNNEAPTQVFNRTVTVR